MAVDRSSAVSARSAFERCVPDQTQRRAVGGLLADLITEAHKAGDRAWSVTLRAKSIRLNVGGLLQFGFSANRAWGILLAPAKLDNAARDTLKVIAEDEGPPAVMPDLSWYRIPASEFIQHMATWRDAAVAAVAAAGRRWTVTPYARSYSPGVLAYLEELLDRSLPRASHAASSAEDVDLEEESVRYWKIAPGEQATIWEECRDGSYIALGWSELPDFEEVTESDYEETWGPLTPSGRTTLRALWDFRNTPVGSGIVANRGTREVVGLGRVTGSYYFVEGDTYPHRLPVEWSDCTVRRVTRPGWRRTLVRLSEDEFEAMRAAPRVGDEATQPLFTRRTFELLDALRDAPVKETYDARKDEFKSHVIAPMKRLFVQVAERMPHAIDEVLETRKRVVSSLLKNDYGQGGAYHHIWGAFYDTDGVRVRNAQLFVWMDSDRLEVGFTTRPDPDSTKRLRHNLGEFRDVVLPALEDELQGVPLVFGHRDSDRWTGDTDWTDPEGPQSLSEWLQDPSSGPTITNHIRREELVDLAEEDLVDRVAFMFQGLFPLMALAISDDPRPILQDYGLLEVDPDPPVVVGPKPYTLDDALSDLFIERDDLVSLGGLIRRKRNVILQGPPGTGKTFAAKRIARMLVGHTDPSHVGFVQFHPSYAYEDFIQGYRPVPGGGFDLHDGVFHRFCRTASERPDETYVFVIDEINRGNLGKVFGELMVLIEADKRGEEHALHLAYARAGDARFFVPKNVILLGLMNTADRSLAVVDYALRRRFAFWDLRPAIGGAAFATHVTGRGVPSSVVQRIVRRVSRLNDAIRGKPALGEGFEIGHSFFCPPDGGVADAEAWWREVVDYELEPLLREYCFDRPSMASELLAILDADE